MDALVSSAPLRIALVGVPNCGKTALFNRLTGSRQKVANYPGVTVERREGERAAADGRTLRVLDLPGTYSLSPTTLDEAITRDVLLGRVADAPVPELVVCVVDAVHLPIGLRLALEVKRLGLPMVLALNRMDVAARRHVHIDVPRLAAELGVPVLPTVAVKRGGADALIEAIEPAHWIAHRIVSAPAWQEASAEDAEQTQSDLRGVLAAVGYSAPKENRWIARVDALLLHPVAGLVVLAAVLFVMFQAVFSWAEAPMDWIDGAMAQLGNYTAAHLPAGPLASLLVNGVIAGAGSVLVFLPQILILFLFILALEDSGYLPRAAYLLDRLMGGVGLSGRAFIPLLSSFACAIPGIMATRTIPNWRDRLTTIMIAPLMTCSARLPVYALLIGALIPARAVGPFNLKGLVMFVLYLAGIVSALIVAWVMKQFAGKRQYSPLMLELPGLSMAARREPVVRPVGAREDLPLPRRRHHPRADDRVVVSLQLPGAARGRHRATHPVQLRRKTRRAAPVPVRADRLQLADLDRAGAGAGGARSRGGRTRHRVRDVRGRKRRCRTARAGDREHLEPGDRLLVAGVVRVRTAMPLDAGRRQA